MHPSIIKGGGQLQSTSPHSWAQFGCPLCPKFSTTQGETLRRHLGAHVQNAVHLQDTIICRCNLSCRDTGHYHCPNCAKTIVRKRDITSHVTGCQRPCDKVPPPCETISSQSADVSQSAPSSSLVFTPCASQEKSANSPGCTSSKPDSEPNSPLSAPEDSITNEDHCYTLSPKASLLSPSVSPQSSPPPSASPLKASELDLSPRDEVSAAATAATAARSETTELTCFRVANLKSVKCPHCSIVLYKKNLSVHIQRKHAMLKDITGSSHLEYVDRNCSTGTPVPSRGHLSRGESVVIILLKKINK
ncbi:uncharacterized protein LOC118106371 [Hippoglossus stenolepis]|uniref:uncharacterized protein LOC118106371 n=1 Tax=Hippoglossus stenolepis TaxID=195615 RepID=UPI001FAEA934|nr:uncharacterized protein LOC118106371 [Hippoglossus stenolepis]